MDRVRWTLFAISKAYSRFGHLVLVSCRRFLATNKDV